VRVLIVDDEPVARHGIRLALRTEPDVEIVGECVTGRSAIEAIRELAPDVVFLDIHIPLLDGIEVATRIAAPNAPAIIFTTAFEQYALDAFALQAVDYLVKPWRKERFRQALGRARLLLEATGRLSRAADLKAAHKLRLPVVCSSTIRFVDSSDIELLESAANYVALFTPSMEHLVRGTLAHYEKKLQPFGFVRIHRSRLINTSRVAQLRSLRHGEYEVQLGSGRVVRSARSFKKVLETALLTTRAQDPAPTRSGV
jgi:two-component system, LytTR family, response regulator